MKAGVTSLNAAVCAFAEGARSAPASAHPHQMRGRSNGCMTTSHAGTPTSLRPAHRVVLGFVSLLALHPVPTPEAHGSTRVAPATRWTLKDSATSMGGADGTPDGVVASDRRVRRHRVRRQRDHSHGAQ